MSYHQGSAGSAAASQFGPLNIGSISAGNAVTAPPNGLILDAGVITGRLRGIRDRVAMLNDRLNGHRPQPADKDDAIEETLRSFTDRSLELLNSIDVELSVIEAKI